MGSDRIEQLGLFLFILPNGRFADIDEDAPPTHLLVSDYPTWLA